MKNESDKIFEKVVSRTVDLYKILKAMGIRDHTGQWLNFLHSDITMTEEQKKPRQLMDNIIKFTVKQNDQVSPGLVYVRISELIAKAIWFTQDYPDFPSSARDEIKILFEYEAQRFVDIPLTYLIADDKPVKFGVVTIHNITPEDQNGMWWEFIRSSGGNSENVRAYAEVTSFGDLEKSRTSARSVVNDMLIFMRAVGFPVNAQMKHEFGILGEYPSSRNLPYRTGRPVETQQLENHVESSMATGPGIFPYDVQKDVLDSLVPSNLERLQVLIENDYFKPASELSELKRKYF